MVGRHLFYNESVFDGNNPAINAADDGAIAPDKSALQSLDQATFANYSSFRKGITGVMVDIAGASNLSLDDFAFRTGGRRLQGRHGPRIIRRPRQRHPYPCRGDG